MGPAGAWRQFKGGGGEIAREEGGYVVWGGGRIVKIVAKFVGGGLLKIKKIDMYSISFIKLN